MTPLCKSTMLAAIVLLCVLCARAQRNIYDHTPNARATLRGDQTVRGYRLSKDGRTIYQADRVFLRLPAVPQEANPKLLGMLRHGDNLEVFVDWMVYDNTAGTCHHTIEIFHGEPGGTAVLVQVLTLSGGPGSSLRVFQPPDASQSPTVLLNIMGDTNSSTAYLLSPDRKSADKVFTAYDYEFADLGRDGNFELIAWNRRPFDIRCGFAIADVRYYPEVFVPSGSGYRRAWPPQDWPPAYGGLEGRFKDHAKDVPWGAPLQIVAGFADLLGDGKAELIVLQDQFREEAAQSLAIYKLDKAAFAPVAQASLPPERIAFLLEGLRSSPRGNEKEIVVRSATPAKCDDGGNYDGSGTRQTAYVLRDGKLQPVANQPPR